MNNLKKWVLKPYPFPKTIKSKLLISFGLGFFISFFLILFKPFEYYKLTKGEMYSYSFIYGFITISVLLFNFMVLPLIFKSFFNSYTWNIKKMILFVFNIIFNIGFFNWITSDYSSFNSEGSKYGFLFFQFTTFLIGTFPLLIYIYFTERIINKKNKSTALNIELNQKKQTALINIEKKEKTEIKLIGDNKKEELSLSLKKLIYINSEKNYASIFHLQNDIVKETLLRISLNKIEKQLSDYPHIVRCHKSYIVNTRLVKEIQGNARGYLLKIDNSSTLIPVSRSFPKELLFTLVNK